MKTGQIRLIQDTYTVPAEVGGYLVTCPGCGARINLYDMYHGFCPWCESSMKKHRDRMIRILRTLDYRIDQSESKNVIVPAGYLPVPQLQHWLERFPVRSLAEGTPVKSLKSRSSMKGTSTFARLVRGLPGRSL